MIPEERRQKIYARLVETGAVRVSDLSLELGASETTIRRDLGRLEARGLLERTHGGSILTRRMEAEPQYREKHEREVVAKAAIGRAAASLAAPGETIFVNSGSTNRQVLRYLAHVDGIRVVTNNASAVDVWQGESELVVVGGRYRSRSNSFVGPLAAQAIRSMHADRCFIGVDGISVKHGLTTPNESESEIARLMIEATLGPVAAVADHTKVGVVAHFVSSSIDDISLLVTDAAVPDDVEQALSEHGVDIVCA